ncbi:hypothetical protein [Methanococcus maripaludis]|uniref:PKD domain-containing protein n=1 Tax=Methanococcus maripaludis TaxID=39152 RepID=A0A7J9PMW1_METMI|nr:hypothetical protein [Methanococcus maripaludis]MBA2864431.1 hypothetical protein [Methanococcus maripaludis]
MQIKKKFQKSISILILFFILAAAVPTSFASSQNIQYYVDVTVSNPNNVTINQTIEINLTDIVNWDEVQSDGSDIQISYLGTPINQELSDFSKASEIGILTVQIEDIASESDRTLKLYFGKQKYTSVPGLDEDFTDSTTMGGYRPYWIEYDGTDYWAWVQTNGSEPITITQTGSYAPNGTEVFNYFDGFDEDLGYTAYRTYSTGSRSFTITDGKLVATDTSGTDERWIYTKDDELLEDGEIVEIDLESVSNTASTKWQVHTLVISTSQTSIAQYGEWGYSGGTTNYYRAVLNGNTYTTTISYNDTLSLSRNGNNFTTWLNYEPIFSYDLSSYADDNYYFGIQSGDCYDGAESESVWDNLRVRTYIENEPEVSQDGNTYEIGECSETNYEIRLNISGIVTSISDSLEIAGSCDYVSLELTTSEIYVEGGYDLEITANDAVLVNSEYELLLQPNYAVYQNVVDFGDGTVLTQSSNSFTHTYTATGTYSILIKSYLDASTYFERSMSVLVTTNTQNITVYLKEENEKTDWDKNVTVYTPFGIYNTNTTLTDISAINDGYISATNLDGIVRSLYVSDSTQYTFYFPENDSYLVEIVLNSYFDDKISVKGQEGSTIYEGEKKISPSLQKGKLYRIYVNDVYYDDFIADSAKEIQVESTGVAYLDLQFHSYLEEIVFSGSTASGTKEVTLHFETNETSKNFTYTISTTGYEQTFTYPEIAGYLNLTNATDATLVSVTLYENTTLLKSYTMYLYPQGTAENPTFLEKGYYAILIIILLMLIFASRLSLHLALLLGSGVFLVLAYPFGIYRLFTTWNLVGGLIGISILVFISYRIWRYPE